MQSEAAKNNAANASLAPQGVFMRHTSAAPCSPASLLLQIVFTLTLLALSLMFTVCSTTWL